jgi:hypothetical protein
MKKVIFVIFVLGFTSSFFGQIEPKHTFTMEIGMPIPVSNQVFKGIMKSIVSISPYYQYRMKNSLTFGAGVNYTYLQIDKFKVPTAEPAKGGVQSGSFFLKVGHEKFHNEQFATDLGVKVGYTQTYFTTNYNDSIYGKPLQVNSITITPTLGLILSVDEFSSYRLTLGYAINGYGFSPQRLGIHTNAGYDPSKFSKLTQCFIVGFGYTHYFSKNKSQDN